MSAPVLYVMLHLLYLFLLCFHPSASLTSLRPQGAGSAGPPGCPELPYESWELQSQRQAPTAGHRRHPERTPDRRAGGLIRTDPDFDPNAKARVPHPEILAPKPLQHWHPHTERILMDNGRCKDRKDTSEDGAETEELERKKGGNDKESGRGGDVTEGEDRCQVAIGEVKEERQR